LRAIRAWLQLEHSPAAFESPFAVIGPVDVGRFASTGSSLQSEGMGRLKTAIARVARILELTEQALVDRVVQPLPEDAFERHLAFRWDSRAGTGQLVPIEEPDLFDLDDLIGVDRAVGRLVANVEQFVAGHPANHVLLYGDRGTGKSSSVKGLLGRFGGRGLRVAEVHKDDLFELPAVLAALRPAPYRFLLFCDDLAFDAGEKRFRELKAVLEGSLVAPPGNVLIVATSNRRHLVAESRADNRDAHLDEAGELRMGEAVDEKLALSDRFGLVLGYYGFDQQTYLAIVERYARKRGAHGVPAEPWLRVTWAILERGVPSGGEWIVQR
jgi:predicted AAA+ superfamily ATPase